MKGISVIEHNNADLYGEGQWTGTPATADGSQAPLPVYPQPTDLPLPDLRVPFGVGIALGLGIGLLISGVYL